MPDDADDSPTGAGDKTPEQAPQPAAEKKESGKKESWNRQPSDSQEVERTSSGNQKPSRLSRRRSRPPPLQIDPGAAGDDDEWEEENNTDWVPMQSRTQGRPYYYHTVSKETTWDKPDDYDDDLPDGAPGWVEMESRTQGRWYYYNTKTKECVWERPTGVPEPAPFERRQLDPRREYLREQINVWADDFLKEHGREPEEGDIPAGSDIHRMHRDYKMLKDDAEYDKLKKEQEDLRKQLNPDARDRLREIKERLVELTEPVEEWRATKEKERKRRDEVTTAYNTWIKSFTDENGRPPTEKDIPTGCQIQDMFQEYTQYREDARRAKERQGRSEKLKDRARNEQDEQKIRRFMQEFEQQHGRKPTRRDLPKGSEIETLYTAFITRLPQDSPHRRQDQLMKRMASWMEKFEREKGRAATKHDIQKDPEMAKLNQELDELKKGDKGKDEKGGKRRAGNSVVGRKDKSGPVSKSGTQGRTPSQLPGVGPGGSRDDEEYNEELRAMNPNSPSSHYQYERGGKKNPGCADCCVVQ